MTVQTEMIQLSFLKVVNDVEVEWRAGGKLFHARGPATANARSLMDARRVDVTTRSEVVGDVKPYSLSHPLHHDWSSWTAACASSDDDDEACSTARTTRVSRYQSVFLLELLELIVSTGAVRRAKFQSNRHHQQTNNTQLFTGRMPFLSPN